MAKANTEQLKAIEHNGGVLLKAGAGSGKTFVLKEHMIYLTAKWIKEYRESNSLIEFSQYIKSKFSKIVLMTFTKKAAGEISIRLNNEFELSSANAKEDEQFFWAEACEQLDYLTVTTIHGFCFKLIKQGFFPEIDLDDDMISQAEYDRKISDIFNLWVENQLENEEDLEFIDLLLKDKEQVLLSVKSIFSDPTLRRMWAELSTKEDLVTSSDKTIQDLIQIFGVKELFEVSFDSIAYAEFNGKTWYEFLKAFEQIKKEIKSLDDLLEINTFFKNLNYKIPITPRAKGVDEEVKIYYGLVKELNSFCKNVGNDFVEYREHFHGHITSWFQKICQLISFIEKEYQKSNGITFSDLEYVVRMGLDNEDISRSISESYEYLIIDEFQDTSFIQFEMIQKILNNDFSKLFCVGDIKQAIYGFRGGELGVFLKCEEMIPKVLSLKNNYRSDKNIIHFNNNFFENLFKKGVKFEGQDIQPVEVEYQEVPLEDRPEGKVYFINSNIDFLAEFGINKVSSNEVDYIEALSLFTEIESLLSLEKDNICVLYKKLKPSLLLIGLLIENKIGFTAQIKVPYGQDPIMGIFKALVEKEFNLNEKKDDYLLLVLRSYFALLDASLEINLKGLIEQFENDLKYYGLYRAFYSFISNSGLANSNYLNNLVHIKTLCSLGSDNKEDVLNILNAEVDNAYSLDFQYGMNASKVTLMTAHASKGLEFKNILLGGIYTNAKSFPFTALFGKFPMSFKWGKTITSKEKFKTPEYYFEAEVTKHKDFSESKRLFYVACTRAEEELGWVKIDFGKIKRIKQSSAWASGADVWEKDIIHNNPKMFETIKANSKELNIKEGFSLRFLENSSNRKPLFHIDSLGTTKKHIQNQLSILPELSVTRLASISQCPRKFYLQNICKLDDSDIKVLNGEHAQLGLSDEDSLTSKTFSSSAERGTRVHLLLEKTLKNDFQYPAEITEKETQLISWAVDKLRDFRDNFLFISEKMIKFEVYNYMISGIPDLIVLNKDKTQNSEIWDYKTGTRKESSEVPYTFQLMSYAYALYTLGEVSMDKQINLVLCYLDEQKLVEQLVSFADVDKYLSNYWKQTSNPDLTNQDHCLQCIYNSICKS